MLMIYIGSDRLKCPEEQVDIYLLVKAPKGMAVGEAALDLLANVEVRGLRLPVVVRRNKHESSPQLTVQLWG